MNVRTCVAIAMMLVSPSGAWAGGADRSKPEGQPAKEKKICERQMSTGSIMAHTVCHTQSEWAAERAVNQANTNRMHESATMRTDGQLPR